MLAQQNAAELLEPRWGVTERTDHRFALGVMSAGTLVIRP